MKVAFSTEAKADLREIALYIARDNKTRARSFVNDLRAKAHDIAAMPQAFPLVPRFRHIGIRRRVFADYLIFYKIDVDVVHIIHILHGSQNYEDLLFP